MTEIDPAALEAARIYVDHDREFRSPVLPRDRYRAAQAPGPGARISNPPVPGREQPDEDFRFLPQVRDEEIERYGEEYARELGGR